MREDIILAAATLGHEFKYARKDFQNLLKNVKLDTPYLVMDPITTVPKYSNTGALVNREYSGHFMLLMKSELNEEYHEKVTKYIEPLELELEKLRLKFIGCGPNYTVKWSYDEIVNRLSVNMDGLIVKFTITEEF